MALNKNHETEEFNGVKCAVVEKGISAERAEFLKKLLEFNGYHVETAANIPAKPKTAPAVMPASAIAVEATAAHTELPESAPPLFNLGVTDLMFNTINAIFGRLLKTPDGHIVTFAYWNQKEPVSHDEVPYYEKK